MANNKNTKVKVEGLTETEKEADKNSVESKQVKAEVTQEVVESKPKKEIKTKVKSKSEPKKVSKLEDGTIITDF